jgi:uncharacterized protein YggE
VNIFGLDALKKNRSITQRRIVAMRNRCKPSSSRRNNREGITMGRFAFLSAALLFCSVGVAAETPNEFAVTGYGKIFYTVDIADIRFSVSVRDNDVQQCKKKHDSILDVVNAYLQENGYPEGIVSLQSTTLWRQRASSGKPEDEFYLARSVYGMRTDRTKDLASLQAALVELGIDEILSVDLFSSKQRQLEDEATKLAFKDAKEKAQLTAACLGWTLRNATKVTYAPSLWRSPPRGFGSRGSAVSPETSPLAASANFVDVTVNVSFRYEVEDAAESKPATDSQ